MLLIKTKILSKRKNVSFVRNIINDSFFIYLYICLAVSLFRTDRSKNKSYCAMKRLIVVMWFFMTLSLVVYLLTAKVQDT